MSFKILGSATVRCAKHESPIPVCDTCSFLKNWSDEMILLKQHRAKMLKDLEKKLAAREIIMMGFS